MTEIDSNSSGLNNDRDPQETKEWIEALRAVFQAYGSEGADISQNILEILKLRKKLKILSVGIRL